ncbi:MAG: hypothetical protein ABR567_16035 [Myxococcales bacterium]
MRRVLSLLVLVVACQRNEIHRVIPPDQRIDVFPQVDRAQLDALFVIDDSRYMAGVQKRVADSFHRFVEYLALNQIDWHAGLLTSDVSAQPGQYQGGGKLYLTSSDNVAQAVLALGTGGSAASAVLQQADLGLRGPPQGFLRDGAALFIVLVTDNDDSWSPGEDLYYYRAFKQSKGPGNDGLVRMSVLAGPSPKGCTIVDPTNPSNTFFVVPSVRLAGLAEQMGGDVHDLCDPDFDAVFDQLGATAAGLKHNFRLTAAPDPATLLVTVHAPCDAQRAALAACAQLSDECGESQPALVCTPKQAAQDGYLYDPSTLSLVFSGAAVPPRGSVVEA